MGVATGEDLVFGEINSEGGLLCISSSARQHAWQDGEFTSCDFLEPSTPAAEEMIIYFIGN